MSLPGIEQVAFSKIKGITPETAGAILAAVGSEAEFFRMSERELAELASAGSHIFAASYREGLLCEAEKELDFVARNGIRCLYFRNQDYPARFQNVPDAPLLIYAKGDTDFNARCAVGIVGTRHATVYGQKLTRDLVAGLGELVGKRCGCCQRAGVWRRCRGAFGGVGVRDAYGGCDGARAGYDISGAASLCGCRHCAPPRSCDNGVWLPDARASV